MRLRHLVVGTVVAMTASLAGASVGSGAVLAFGPPGPVDPPADTAKVGVHALIDTVEYPAITCRYDSSLPPLLRSMTIRRPIIYARSRTSHVDHQPVGWRYQILGWDSVSWHQVAQSPLMRATASDVTDALLHGKVYTFSSLDYPAYRVRYRMVWLSPSHPTTQVGTAVHWAETYRTNVGPMPADSEFCPKQKSPALGPPAEPGHSGKRGVHLLLDTIEYPAQTCVYDSNIELDTMLIRPPIVFAAAGKHHQKVGWRYRIQHAPPLSGPWTTSHTSPLMFGTASDTVDASLGPVRSYHFHGTAYTGTHRRFRVLFQLYWYPTSGPPSGRAAHVPAFFRSVNEGPVPYNYAGEACSAVI